MTAAPVLSSLISAETLFHRQHCQRRKDAAEAAPYAKRYLEAEVTRTLHSRDYWLVMIMEATGRTPTGTTDADVERFLAEVEGVA